MPRGSAVKAVEMMPDRGSLIASAAKISRDSYRIRVNQQGWQAQAWAFYDTVGELRFAAGWIGAAMSRVELIVQEQVDGAMIDVTEGPARDALDMLFEGKTGQSGMMSRLGIQLTVPGESFVVGEPQEGDKPDKWFVASTNEISQASGGWRMIDGDGTFRDLHPDTLVVRIWQPHAKLGWQADSSVRACLPVLRELEQLSKHLAANIDSRLAGAGLLLLPSEMTFNSPGGTPEVIVDEPEADPFLRALTEAMITPIEDRSSAAAVVPVIVKAPGAVLDSAKLITFSTPFDEETQSLREESIRRLALGMDMPPEVLLGQAEATHWTAWQIEESALKMHIEPLAELTCSGLTQQYLWSALEAMGVANPYVYRLHYDTSSLRIRPNHANEAVQLYDRLELSGNALRRETGFDTTDAPSDAELQAMILRKTSLGVTNSDMTVAAMHGLGVPLVPQMSEATGGAAGDHDPNPDLLPRNVRRIGRDREQDVPSHESDTPDYQDPSVPAASAVLAACDALASRAIERANNRIGRRSGTPKRCPAEQLDAALDGAWGLVPRTAGLLNLNAAVLTARLDAYARQQLTAGAGHDLVALKTGLFGEDR